MRPIYKFSPSRLTGFVLLLAAAGAVAQPVYRQVDKNGRVTFSDRAPTASTEPAANAQPAPATGANAGLPYELRQIDLQGFGTAPARLELASSLHLRERRCQAPSTASFLRRALETRLRLRSRLAQLGIGRRRVLESSREDKRYVLRPLRYLPPTRGAAA